jgi:hypothetical protein
MRIAGGQVQRFQPDKILGADYTEIDPGDAKALRPAITTSPTFIFGSPFPVRDSNM